jgi:hypothetical protein
VVEERKVSKVEEKTKEEKADVSRSLTNSETFGKFIYESFMMLVIFWNCLEIPFRIGYYLKPFPFEYTIVVAMIDWIFILDCVIRFYIPYLSKSGYYVHSSAKIRKHYLKTFFAIDAVSSIPWDFMVLCLQLSNPALEASLSFFRCEEKRSALLSFFFFEQNQKDMFV